MRNSITDFTTARRKRQKIRRNLCFWRDFFAAAAHCGEAWLATSEGRAVNLDHPKSRAALRCISDWRWHSIRYAEEVERLDQLELIRARRAAA